MSALLDQDTQRRVDEWRKHPNYGKSCECGHRAILHENGTGKCNCAETVVVAKRLQDCRFKYCECTGVRLCRPSGATTEAK